jgi:hypothetical protein
MVMKQSQWAIAAFVLAALVFIVTFAMNYIGGQRQIARSGETRQSGGELRFFWKSAPIGEHGGIEAEVKAPGWYDFWFRNDNTAPVQVGLLRANCKCSGVELAFLSEKGPQLLACTAAALIGAGGLGHFPTYVLHWSAMPKIQESAGTPQELLQGPDSVTVPGEAVGWIRMRWKGEQPGPRSLEATLTFDGKESGKEAVLRTRVFCHEPLRVRPVLSVGVLREADLAKSVTRHIICWSSTRRELQLEVQSTDRANKAADPLVVGEPEPLSLEERRQLEFKNNPIKPSESDNAFGMVLCAYRIPVTLNAVAKDGTPFDIGPISRRVTISCPSVTGEPKQVTIHGRVRGIVEIGNDDDGSEIDFSTFPRSRGKTDKINVQSEVSDLTLEFDRARTPAFLDARLVGPTKNAAGRQTWVLRATVKPDQASGIFPRREDPLFEDSAIYLKATVPTPSGKLIRGVRIAVRGTASES